MSAEPRFDEAAAADFAARFAEYWRAPTPEGLSRVLAERVNYFDSMPVALAAATRPRAWPAFLRSRLRR